MSLFHHHLAFQPIDPLGDGLAEEIAAEQQEPDAMSLDSDIDEQQLSAYWQFVEQDIHENMNQVEQFEEA